MIKVLFVCSANICRSPAAEAIMNAYLKKAGLADKVSCDSAGTNAGQSGHPADAQMRTLADARGYQIEHTARQFTVVDFIEFDYIIPMTQQNYSDIRAEAFDKEQERKIHSMCSFCSKYTVADVPDPYRHSGTKGFNIVLDILEDACFGLLKKIKSDLHA